MKFLVPNYSFLQNHLLRGYRPQIPVPSVLCPQMNLLKFPPPRTKFLGTPLLDLDISYYNLQYHINFYSLQQITAVPSHSKKIAI